MGGMSISRHFINVSGRRVHYRVAGEGPPVLLVHQSPRSSAEHEPLMQQWAAYFSCIAPDTPGFGHSDPLPGEPDVEAFAASLIELMDALGLTRVAAYGFHTGAMILIAALRRFPERFSSVAAGGYAVWTDEERRVLGDAYVPPLQPQPYGEHLVWLWNRVLEQSWFFPWFDVRPGTRLPRAHADPVRVDAIVREMLDSGDAYRAGYRAALAARHERPPATSPPVLLTAYDGDPLASHLERLGSLPRPWIVKRVATPAEQANASRAFLLEHPAPPAGPLRSGADEGFVRVTTGAFAGLIHFRGPREASRILLHAPGGSLELLQSEGALRIDLPGHGLSDHDTRLAAADLPTWGRVVAACVRAVAKHREPVIAGEGLSALLAVAVGREVGAAAVEAEAAHIPCEQDVPAWLTSHPDLTPDRHGTHLIRGWSMVRAATFFWPWFRADADHAIDFAPCDIEPARLALRHRSLMRARAGRALAHALLTADRVKVLERAPAVRAWRLAGWARGRRDIWLLPSCQESIIHGNP